MTKAELEKRLSVAEGRASFAETRVKELEEQVKKLDRIPKNVTKISEMQTLLDVGAGKITARVWEMVDQGYLYWDWSWDLKVTPPNSDVGKQLIAHQQPNYAYLKWMEETMMLACMIADMDPEEPEFAPAKGTIKARMDLWRERRISYGCNRGYTKEEREAYGNE